MLSVIIPTLNAAGDLEAILPVLDVAQSDGLINEVIVVDGGSKDETRAIAARFNTRLFYARKGRGLQLRAGADEAHGKWLLFLHADSKLVPNWAEAVKNFIDDGDTQKAAVFKFALDDISAMARMVEWLVDIRTRMLALPYGDQGLLISRTLYDDIGGFKPLVLMEDVDIIRNLGARRLAFLPARIFTSAKRYRRNGFILRSARNLVILALYFCGVPTRWLARLYG